MNLEVNKIKDSEIELIWTLLRILDEVQKKLGTTLDLDDGTSKKLIRNHKESDQKSLNTYIPAYIYHDNITNSAIKYVLDLNNPSVLKKLRIYLEDEIIADNSQALIKKLEYKIQSEEKYWIIPNITDLLSLLLIHLIQIK